MKNTSTGLKEKVSGTLSYLGFLVTGIIFLGIEKENKYVRFNAMQSTVVFGILTIILAVFGWIPTIGFYVYSFGSALWFVLWFFLMYKAFSGIKYKIPVIGDFAEKHIK